MKAPEGSEIQNQERKKAILAYLGFRLPRRRGYTSCGQLFTQLGLLCIGSQKTWRVAYGACM